MKEKVKIIEPAMKQTEGATRWVVKSYSHNLKIIA